MQVEQDIVARALQEDPLVAVVQVEHILVRSQGRVLLQAVPEQAATLCAVLHGIADHRDIPGFQALLAAVMPHGPPGLTGGKHPAQVTQLLDRLPEVPVHLLLVVQRGVHVEHQLPVGIQGSSGVPCGLGADALRERHYFHPPGPHQDLGVVLPGARGDGHLVLQVVQVAPQEPPPDLAGVVPVVQVDAPVRIHAELPGVLVLGSEQHQDVVLLILERCRVLPGFAVLAGLGRAQNLDFVNEGPEGLVQEKVGSELQAQA